MLEARKMSIKNWERIRLGEGNQLIIKSHESSRLEDLNWTKTISKTLAEHGLQFDYTDKEIKNKHIGLLNRAKNIFHQEAFSTIKKNSSKLRTYSLIKQNIGREDYLLKLRNPKVRGILTKFRLSNHKLRIESGRNEGLRSEERMCQICFEGVEDEIHFLVKCKQYEAQRQPLFDVCRNLKPQFQFYTEKVKFIFIMNSPSIIDIVSKFIANATNEETFTWK